MQAIPSIAGNKDAADYWEATVKQKNTGGRPVKKDKPEDQYFHETAVGGMAALIPEAKFTAEAWGRYHQSNFRRGLHFPRSRTTLKAGQAKLLGTFPARCGTALEERRVIDKLKRWVGTRIQALKRTVNTSGALLAIGDRSAPSAKTWEQRASVLLMFARAWHSAAIEPCYIEGRGLGWRFKASIGVRETPLLLCYGLLDGHVKREKSYKMAMAVRVAGFDRTAWGPFAMANGACPKHSNVYFELVDEDSRPTWLKDHDPYSVIGIYLGEDESVEKGEEVLLDYLMPGDTCPHCGKVGVTNLK